MDNTELLKKYAAYKKVDFSTLEKDFKKSSAFYQKEFIQKIKKSIDFEEEVEAQYGVNFDNKKSLRNLQAENKRTYTNDQNPLSDFGIFSPSPSKIKVGKYEDNYQTSVNPNQPSEIEMGLDDSYGFNKNWYNKRISKDIPDYVYTSEILDSFDEENKKAGAFYDPDTKTSYFRKDSVFTPNIGNHEYTHAVDDYLKTNYKDDSKIRTNYNSLEGVSPSKSLLVGGNKELFEKYNNVKKLGFTDDYYKSPEEVYARLMELRRTANFSPNYQPTSEDIYNLRKQNVNNELFMFFDDDAISKMWNNLAYNKNDNIRENYYSKYGLRKSQYGNYNQNLDEKAQISLQNWYGTRNVVTPPFQIPSSVFKTETHQKNLHPGYNAYYDSADTKVHYSDDTKVKKLTPIHERTHQIDDIYGENISDPNTKYQNNKERLKTDYRKIGVSPIQGRGNNYLNAPEEVYSRLNEMRMYSGFDPNYKPTLEDIENLKVKDLKENAHKSNKLFHTFTTKDIRNMWNNLSGDNYESSTLENPILEQAAKYGGSSILKQLNLL